MKNKTALFALFVALAAAGLALRQPQTRALRPETAYERVLRTMTLRCGYLVLPPFVTIDPNTKKLGGMNYDYVETMAKTLGLSVTWDEVIMGNQVEALRTQKVDAVCAGEGPLIATTTTFLHYSDPIAFFPIYMFARHNDFRFDGSFDSALAKANNPAVTIAYLDGDLSQNFAEKLFSKAKRYELPQTVDVSQVYVDIVTRKADFVIEDPFTAGEYMKNNPGTLRKVSLDKPFAVLPNQMSVLRGEETLADLLSQGIAVMRQQGLEDKILSTYERAYPGAFYRVQDAYKLPPAARE